MSLIKQKDLHTVCQQIRVKVDRWLDRDRVAADINLICGVRWTPTTYEDRCDIRQLRHSLQGLIQRASFCLEQLPDPDKEAL
jgi:PhoPQ-activated pathogenicity-related protein